jgi:5-methylcytosine-specific restriction endonuclease McrA
MRAHDEAPINTRQWQAIRAHVLRTRPPVCHICGGGIDLTLPGTHKDGPTVDHLTPRTRGGTHAPNNLAPAHQRCNAARRNDPLTTNTRNW